MSIYKLVYFNGRGKAETIRLAFALAGFPFQDFRVELDEWPEMKPQTFTGYLPYLEVDGKILIESMAIARFIAREGKFDGETSFQQAQIDAVIDILSGLLDKDLKIVLETNAAQKETLQKDFVEKTLPNVVKLLEKFLGDKHFFINDKLSIADLQFFSVFESVTTMYQEWNELSPKLKALHDRVASQPKIAEYLKKRLVTIW